jgi:hypothetical protein
MTKSKAAIAAKQKEMRLKELKIFVKMVKDKGCTWESHDPPYEPFIRYCNIRKYVKEIIAVSEEDINIRMEYIDMLNFWAPDLDIDQPEDETSEKETSEDEIDLKIDNEKLSETVQK